MFMGQMLFLMPNEQRHSTEGKSEGSYVALKRRVRLMLVQELLSVYEWWGTAHVIDGLRDLEHTCVHFYEADVTEQINGRKLITDVAL